MATEETHFEVATSDGPLSVSAPTGPTTHETAGELVHYEEKRGPLRRFLDGEDVPHEELRAALHEHNEGLRMYQRNAEALELAYSETTSVLRDLSQQAGSKASMLYESWNEDEWVHGHMQGEAVVWRSVQVTLGYLCNALVGRREAFRRQVERREEAA